eukprot:6154362-Amphidinium_carterae.1
MLHSASSHNGLQAASWSTLVSPRRPQPTAVPKPWQYGMPGLSPASSLSGNLGGVAGTPRSKNFPLLSMNQDRVREGLNLGQRGCIAPATPAPPASLQVQHEVQGGEKHRTSN